MAAAGRLEQLHRHLLPPADPSRLDGQVVLITGGAQGIGRASATLLASKGAKVAISDLDKNKADAAVEELTSLGYEAFAFTGDLLQPELAQALVNAVLERFGKINVLVNGAGKWHFHKMSEDQFDVVMKVHNYVPYRLIKALSSHWMDAANRDMPKVIVNISSVSGLHGAQGQINYCTAKAGVLGLTKAVAKEWSRFNVRCNAVAYGWIDTRMTRLPEESGKFSSGGLQISAGIPQTFKKWRDTSDILVRERPGTAEEAASAVLFLASPLSSYVTGTTLECTGGRYL
ncbi:NAD(P)-binding protein [Thozetella sp. PMI_491]|nr:NAD(P)-binding protein [Thozetella sp. PMI_491]